MKEKQEAARRGTRAYDERLVPALLDRGRHLVENEKDGTPLLLVPEG